MINKFIDTPTSVYDEMEFPQRKDILYIPWLYTPNYCIEENKLLSKIFTTYPHQEARAQRDKQIETYKYHINAMNEIRVSSKMFKGIYFNNIIDDFDIHYYSVGQIDKYYGFQHDSSKQMYLQAKSQNKDMLVEHENYVHKVATKIFVASNFMKSFLNDYVDSDVIGLPIFREPVHSTRDNRILFNHRFAKEKNWHMLFDLPENMKKQLVVTTPTISAPNSYGVHFTRAKKDFGMISNCRKDIVDNYQDTVGFGLSLSTADNFGISVLEGIMSGLFYMCWDNEYNCFNEILLPEFLFKTLDELVEKYNYYSENSIKRLELVKEQQQLLLKYTPKNWVNNLLERI